MPDIKKILVAVDFSETSANALKVALDLGGKLNAQLDVIHTVALSAVSLPVDGQPMVNEELLEEEIGAAKHKLAEFMREHGYGEDEISQHVIWGEPNIEVNNFAKENRADMIVIGTHGRTGLKHLLMGSVAESILRHANVPVVCVRSK